MLKTRVITAVILLAVLLTVLFSHSFPLFVVGAAVFLTSATWESLKLFRSKWPLVGALFWSLAFLLVVFFEGDNTRLIWLCGICVAIWVLRLAPSLKIGMPALETGASRLLSGVYGITIFGCFTAIVLLLGHSPLYLLSVMAIVWIADIGAYFAGKAFGKHKLAPSISPGKSWEGAVGGWITVLILVGASLAIPQFIETFGARVYAKWGVAGFCIAMTVLVAASIVGDLFESQLKRRAGIKDSSNLLPGHGGVLDRIDALIPALPLAVLIDTWL